MSKLALRYASPDQRFAAPTLIVVLFINMMGFGIIVPLLPFFAKSFHAPAWQIALVFSAYSLGAFFGEPFWGRLSDRYGRKPILISTVCGNCILYFALAHAPNVWAAFAMRFIGGLTSGNAAVVQGYLADVTPAARRSRIFSYIAAASNVGLIVGPTIGGIFAHPGAGPVGFRIPLYIAACLSAVSASCIALFIRESRAREQVLAHRPNRWAALGEALAHPVISRLFLLTFLAGFAFTGIESSFGLWGQARFGWGPREVGVCFAFVGVTAAFTQMTLTGRLSERFGEGVMLAAGMAVIMVAAALQPLSTGAPMTIFLMCCIAIGWSVAFPNVGALISRTVDVHRQGQILGLNNACAALARTTGPFCAALGFSHLTIDAPFLQAALIAAPAIWLALAAARRVGRLAPRDAASEVVALH
jgi:DHA1 family tetracycline resistance protein-like MFS transporter